MGAGDGTDALSPENRAKGCGSEVDRYVGEVRDLGGGTYGPDGDLLVRLRRRSRRLADGEVQKGVSEGDRVSTQSGRGIGGARARRQDARGRRKIGQGKARSS